MNFLYDIYSDTGGEYDRAVVTNGEAMVEVRLTPGTAHIQTSPSSMEVREDVDVGQFIREVVKFVDGRLCEEGNVHVGN